MTEKDKYKRISKAAMQKYNIEVEDIVFFTEASNTFYKIRDKSGEKYLIKIFQEESSKIEDNLAEVFFIDIIKDKTDIVVPTVISSKTEKRVIEIESEEFSTPKRAILYEWIDGKDFYGRESYEHFKELGKITARMHLATKHILIPEKLNPKKWDKVFYYREEKPVYKMKKYNNIVTKEFIEIMDFIVPVIDKKLSELYKNDTPQLIHADLNPWNILIENEELKVVDFEEAILGFPIQDFSIFLFYYKGNKKFEFLRVKESFIEGYSKIIIDFKFDEFTVEMLMIARRVNFMNYVIDINEDPKNYIKKSLPIVKRFIKDYL